MPPTVKIFVAHHKPAPVISDESICPIQVGAALSSVRLKDMQYYDDGAEDNISALNRKYCELTGMYYAWKNVDADYYGFCHYRRYFSFSEKHNFFTSYSERGKNATAEKLIEKYGLTSGNAVNFVKDFDMIMQKPYYIFITNRAMYNISPSAKVKDLDFCLDVIKRDYPAMYKTAKRYLHSPMSYTCNMFIMKREIFHEYCEWLFHILGEFDKNVDCSGYNAVQYRVDGYLAERLAGIYYTYLKKQKKYRLRTVSRVYITSPQQQ